MSILSSTEWDQFLEHKPEAHLLQTSMWGDLKSNFDWQAVRLANETAGAQILFRKLPLGLSLAYIPKGPVGTNWAGLWPEIHTICKQKHAIYLHVEPDINEPFDDRLLVDLQGFIPVDDTIQPRQTILIDLSGSPDDWLSRMKQKTRYNTRLAEKKEIQVSETQDFITFEQLMRVTGTRDGFGVHTLEYYRQAYSIFSRRGQVALLQATYQNQPLVMLMVFAQGKGAYYLYGASVDEERQRMPAYLLQFEAMRWAASKGCEYYDLWGIPDATEEELEAQFEVRSDGLWGVYRFKRGFGGRILRSCPGFDHIYQPLLYRMIRWQMNHGRRSAAG
jgi:peptidoglycan pentaglycine glycine transferase (the first glycine)